MWIEVGDVGDSVAIAVRCLIKKNIPETHLNVLKQKSHTFSLVATFTELMENSADSDLYAQMAAINEVKIIAIGDISGEADLDCFANNLIWECRKLI